MRRSGKEKQAKSRSRGHGEESWRTAVLVLFGITIILSALTVLGGVGIAEKAHITGVEIFTDLSGAGTLLSGIAAVAVCVVGYLDRRKKNGGQVPEGVLLKARQEALLETMRRIDHGLTPDDMSAMAELLRALGGEEKDVDDRAGGLRPRHALQIGMLDRLQTRFVRDVIIFTGLSPLTMPLLRRLAETARGPHAIVVIEPDRANALLDEARSLGTRVVIGSPVSPDLLRPIISTWRGCALSHLYALQSKAAENEIVIAETARILSRYQPGPDCRPHLVALVDDSLHADYWRGTNSGTLSGWFEEALSTAESTARTLVARLLHASPKQVLMCGDSTFTRAILLELARRAWEQAELVKAAAAGRAAQPDVASPPDAPAPLPLERVALLDPRSPDIRREYLASVSGAALGSLPSVDEHPVQWREHLLRTLDSMDPVRVRETAVVITEETPGNGIHEAGRVARLHPETPVFVLASSGHVTSGAISGLLYPFEPGLLIEGELPEGTWERISRLWHEYYRLSHPVPPGHPKAAARLPWSELDPYFKQDNILQLGSVLVAVTTRGRRWVPVHQVPAGSVIELSEDDVTAVATAEHVRWQARRRADGRVGEFAVLWPELPSFMRDEIRAQLRWQLSYLEGVGLVPIIPVGGPPEAARFERVGLVRASQLSEPLVWITSAGDEMHGVPGDWRVVDGVGNVRMVSDPDFQASHEPVGVGRWRRVGEYQAWRVGETVVVRTKEGNATARPGDWIVEAPTGERWPVQDEQFSASYRPSPIHR
jgi:hypothetical protein